MITVLYPVAIISEKMSPWPPQYSRFVDDDEVVELSDFTEMDHDAPIPRILTGAKWPTTSRHIRECFFAERRRRMNYLSRLASRLEFTAGESHFFADGLVYRTLKHAFYPFPKPSRRLIRLLCSAVEAAGKRLNPKGPLVIDPEYWLSAANEYFSLILQQEDNPGLILDQPFLPPLVEWLRLASIVAGRNLRMIRVVVGLSGEAHQFEEEISHVTISLRDIAHQLERVPSSGWGFYQTGATLANQLGNRFDARNGATLEALFMEEPGRGVQIPAVGVTLPRSNGYVLTLNDGTQQILPDPPWQMGYSISPGDKRGPRSSSKRAGSGGGDAGDN